ncbi:MAG: DUF3604 domain-containing protein [Halioglobus sp.]
MIKKIALIFSIGLVAIFGGFYAVGSGWFGGPWQSAAPVEGPRKAANFVGAIEAGEPRVLFGDLHNHSNYSLDAYVFNTQLVKGTGKVTPADACDFARYCSALDFWSINDHAESLSPRVWADTVKTIRACNDSAGDPKNPDMVSFVGWEWSNINRDDVPSHYGHKNVIFRTWEDGLTPTRPIAAKSIYDISRAPRFLLGLMSLVENFNVASDFGWYSAEGSSVPICPDNVPADQLPDSCREVALTPTSLYRKLDEWGFDSLVIPHGLAWGNVNPLTADFRDQLDEYEERYQKLVEVFSGHGNSELFVDFDRVSLNGDAERTCPPPSEKFTPCCRQAEKIVRSRCDDPTSEACEASVNNALSEYLKKDGMAGRKTLAGTTLDDWEGCGQLQDSFQPSAAYVPRMSAQYNLALGFDAQGKPKRVKMGLIGSSDGHQARPGSSYKETNRLLYTDSKSVGKNSAYPFKADKESGSFYYTGGLVAAHTTGRDRDSIWQALDSRNVYATSGGRMLVWFDLINGPLGEAPMGSEVLMTASPKFRVKALGAFEQVPGCPDYAVAALGKKRIETLCGGECYRPGGDKRKALSRIEIVKIQPQISPDEEIAPLVLDPFKVFDCPQDGSACVAEFEDAAYPSKGRAALYYARVIQVAEPIIGGDPFGCEFNSAGECVKRNYCIGTEATRDNNCLAPAEPRAWTSPIFVEYPL